MSRDDDSENSDVDLLVTLAPGTNALALGGLLLVQDAVVRNLQTLAESSQRSSSEIKRTELRIPWRELAGFRNVIVHGYLALTLGPSGWSSNKTCQR